MPICELSEKPEQEYDLLLVGWSHWLGFTSEGLAELRRRVARARRIVLFYDAQFGNYGQMLFQQARAWRANADWLKRVEAVCYSIIYPRLDLCSGFRPRFPLAVGPNIHFLYEAEAQELLARPWPVEATRRFALTATGARGPYRAALCDHLFDLFSKHPGLRLCDSRNPNGSAAVPAASSPGVSPGKNQGSETLPALAGADARATERREVAWTVDGPRITLGEYVALLDDTDFLICLPGTSWTHRPFEALARGAIPVLDAVNMRMHDIPWQDGVNCLVVKRPACHANWSRTIERALRLGPSEIAAMRRNIAQLQGTHIAMGEFLARLRRRFGVD